jgi:hypothetical protein
MAAVIVAWPGARDFRPAILVVIGGFYGGLAALEVAVRVSSFGVDAVAHPTRYTFDWLPMRSLDGSRDRFTFVPGYTGVLHGRPVRINRDGFRGPDFSEGHEGVFRLMAFGSSITVGEGTRERDAYVAVAADRLAARTGAHVEGINCGVVSFGMEQALWMARRYVDAYSPDVLILEVRTQGGDIDPAHGKLPLPTSEVPSPLTRLSFARRALAIIPDHVRAVSGRFWSRSARPSANDESGALHTLEDGIGELALAAEKHHTRIFVLLFSPMADPEGSALSPPIAAHLQALARRTGVQLLDTSGIVKPSELSDSFIVFPGDAHPNARANARFGERIADAILATDAVPTAPERFSERAR